MAGAVVATVLTVAAVQQTRKAQKAQEKSQKLQVAQQREEQKRRGRQAAIQQRRENFARLREVLAAQGETVNRGGGEGLALSDSSSIQGALAGPETQFAQGVGVANQRGSIDRTSLSRQNSLLSASADAASAAAKFGSNANLLFSLGGMASGFAGQGLPGGGGSGDFAGAARPTSGGQQLAGPFRADGTF